MRDIIYTASLGYLLEPFKQGDSFPKELIRYAKGITKTVSQKEWGHDMTAFFHDSNEPAYFSSGDTSLYWWQTPQSYEINVLEIIRKISSRFPEIEFCFSRIHTDTLGPNLYIKGPYIEEVADDILVVESDDLESITHLAQKFNAERQNNRALFSMDRVGKSKLLELVNSYVSMIKEAFPDADFNYLLWDKKVRSFQIKRKIYYHRSEAYLDVISYKEREVLPDLDKTELMHSGPCRGLYSKRGKSTTCQEATDAHLRMPPGAS